MSARTHSPQDQIYGPLNIPSYCWPIIDTPEYQRLRYVAQLGPVQYVFPSANHSRFEHCLGCAHLASTLMEHFEQTQPELNIKPEYKQIVVIASLCHDLGHGPYSHLFDEIVRPSCPTWDHEEMGGEILRYIVKTYNVGIPSDIIEAACAAIKGEEYGDYPKWLFHIIADKKFDIDIDKFDYLARDMNRTLHISKFEYDRLIVNCRITQGKLSWRLSEIPTIERLFFNRNDMHNRVYKHRVALSIGAMIENMFQYINEHLNFAELIKDPKEYCKYDDRIIFLAELGQFGPEAQKIAMDIRYRRLYKCVGELRVRPGNVQGETYSQLPPSKIGDDIAATMNLDSSIFKVIPLKFRYGISKNKHPLLEVPFWKPGCEEIINLQPEDISAIVPAYFAETAMRVFITDSSQLSVAKQAFEKWLTTSPFF
ncbi:HD domain containing protein [Trichomonas vaginalis G3]|uniref:HD domain containing protein n=1 Tax=Trichomonas vaginalis (strain ATCC PRA-98 / G3) TaxID=412133 RepID=A2GCQ3_TRIV3|nr:dGTPase protein [Trichomonas vaginalis G3]EAX85062.1 HD domain containing protein [Trichomonas vaginalis G3]KAI5495186.1 dGTPase protein [Trichomonas vaginalis G3]|eukprot:XP_001297992.1 HD domain containing protein [Trichomonas vaginalis G3]